MYTNQWLKQRISLGIVNERLKIQGLEKNWIPLGVADLLGQQTPSGRDPDISCLADMLASARLRTAIACLTPTPPG
jgi:hypothetical protein